MKITARLERSQPHDRRSKPRHRLRLGTNIKATGENASVHDISSTGMLIETTVDLQPLDALEVDLPENGPTEALVMWSSGQFYGCEFKQPLSKAAISAAFLRSTPTDSQEVSPNSPRHTPTGPTPVVHEDEVAESDNRPADDRLPLRVRAVAIIASSIVLWLLIIWAAEVLIKSVDPSFG